MRHLIITFFFLSISSISFGLTLTCPETFEGHRFVSFGLYDQDPINNYELMPDNFYDPPKSQHWTSLEKTELWLECDYGNYVLDTDHWDAVHSEKIGNGFAKCETSESSESAGFIDTIICN